MAVELKRRLFDNDEYHRMAEAGIFTEDDRGGAHRRRDRRDEPDRRAPRPLRDVPQRGLLRPPLARYARAIPEPGDVLLVVEVADTSQYHHRVVKVPRYAAAGIPEVWIVDLEAGVLDTYRDPAADRYRSTRRLARDETVAPAALPDVALAVDDILG